METNDIIVPKITENGSFQETVLTPSEISAVAKSGDTMTGKLNLPAVTTASAPLSLGSANVDPASPAAGDVWVRNNAIKYRGNSSTVNTVAATTEPNVFSVRQTIQATDNSNPALRVTQLGTGEALRVEDETNPDSTAFVVNGTGKVGIGITPDASVCLSLDSTGLKFGDGTIQTTAGVSPSQKGAANGVASLDANAKIPAVQLPSYVDDVLEFGVFSNLPVTGETGKIYVTVTDSKCYRWSGTAYVEISPSPGSTDSVTEGSSNLYFTDARVRSTVLTGLQTNSGAAVAATDSVLTALGKLQNRTTSGATATAAVGAQIENHIADTNNPHQVTAAQVGAEPAITVLPIAKGGTGANTLEAAKASLGIADQQAYTVVEHFLQGNLALNNLRNLTGGGGSSSSAVTARQYNSTGVVTVVTGTNAVIAHSAIGIDQVNENAVDLSQASKNIFTSRSAFFTLPDASATGMWYSGFVDNYNVVSTNGAYFRIVNAGNLEAVCVSAGVETTQNLGFRPATGAMHLYEVIARDNGTAVDFWYDGSLVATIISNIPTGNTQRVNYATGIVRLSTVVTTSLEFDLDLVFVRLYNTGFTLQY